MERKGTIYIGADHAGFELKEKLKELLRKKGYEADDYGALEYDKNDDYPDYAKALGEAVAKNKQFGVLVCGSAEGMCIAANKVKGIRAVAPYTIEQMKLARSHNDANVLCLAGGGMLRKVKGVGMSPQKAMELVETFIETQFSDEPRHKRRIRKIMKMER